MRAFVTGGSGFIGGHLVESLLSQGSEVRTLVHRSPLPPSEKLEVVVGDICDRATLDRALDGVEILFHLASALGSSVIGREEFRRINVQGTKSILEAARGSGVRRVIHVSSAGVFGAVSQGEVASESSTPAPISIYDKTKLEGEEVALSFARGRMDVVVLRPGWAYGPGDRRTYKLIRAVCSGRFAMVTRGTGMQTPVYIGDLIKGIHLASEKGKRGEVYHLAGGEIMTVREMVDGIALACGRRRSRLFIPLPAARLAAFLIESAYAPWRKEAPFNRSKLAFFVHSKPLSIGKARRDLGFAPAVDFRSGMERTVAWYRNQGWLPPLAG